MFIIAHQNDTIGSSRLESGDPETHSISGVFENVGGPSALAGWLKSIGGQEDDGAVYIEMNKEFQLLTKTGDEISFTEGTLISVPKKSEAFVEFIGVTDEAYKKYFASHIAAMSKD